MTYIIPELEIIELVEIDVITMSSGPETEGNDDGVTWG